MITFPTSPSVGDIYSPDGLRGWRWSGIYWAAMAPVGERGLPGSAATVSVGSVTTGAAGTSASVTNVGTTSAATLDFTIPKGDKGDNGTTLLVMTEAAYDALPVKDSATIYVLI